MGSRRLHPLLSATLWVAATAIVVYQLGILITAIWTLYPTAGLSVDVQGKVGRVTDLTPTLPATKAGLRKNDKLDLADGPTATFADAANGGTLESNTVYPVRLTDGRRLTVRTEQTTYSKRQPLQTAGMVSDFVAFLFSFILAIWFLTIRPGAMSLCLVLFTLGMPSAALTEPTIPPLVTKLTETIGTIIFQGGPSVAILMFALRFPNDSITGWRVLALRTATVFTIVLEVIILVRAMNVAFAGHDLDEVMTGPLEKVVAVSMFVAAALLLASLSGLSPERHNRLLWPVVTMAVAVVCQGFYLGFNDGDDWSVNPHLANLASAALLPAVIYALARDPSRVASKAAATAISGTMVLAAVAVTSIFDASFDKLAKYFNLGIPKDVVPAFGMLLSMGFGILVLVLHGRIKAKTDAVLTRSRREAIRALGQVGVALQEATSAETVWASLTKAPCDTLNLEGAAVFRHDTAEARFVRMAVTSCEAVDAIGEDDEVILRLRAQRALTEFEGDRSAPLSCQTASRMPFVAFPLLVEEELDGVALYGLNEDFGRLGTDAIGALQEFVDAATLALEHLQMTERKAAIGRLEREVAALRDEAVRVHDPNSRRHA
jgi:hypothetical protein